MGGVSATHLDWTMVPYVRKSFFKHYVKNYLKTTDKFNEIDMLNISFDELDDWIDENKQKFLDKFSLSEEDFKLKNKEKLDIHLYNSALFDVKNELNQAVEGMYHNLKVFGRHNGNVMNIAA